MTDPIEPPPRKRGLPLAALSILVCALAGTASQRGAAQEEPARPPGELTAPPRYDERPGETRLALQPEERREALEEIVVVAGGVWRLPDLGSSLRAQRDTEADTGRLAASFLPLYDPEEPTHRHDLSPNDSELHRVGLIELFRIRFGGRRSSD